MNNLVETTTANNNTFANSAILTDKFQNLAISKKMSKEVKGGSIIAEEVAIG